MASSMWNLLILVLVFIVKTNGNYNTCEQKSPCQCTFSDESSISLSSLFPDANFLEATKGDLKYYYHGCRNAEFTVKIANISKTVNNTCSGYSITLCLYNATSKSLTKLGDASKAKFTLNPEHLHSHDLTYVENRTKTSVTLICSEDYVGPILKVENVTKDTHNLVLVSSHVCKIQGSSGLSTGSKLIIMFSVFFGIYLIGGSCLSYFLKGARGREVIPNIDFWTSLPGLVRDGVIFIMGGCNARMVSTADTYDQI